MAEELVQRATEAPLMASLSDSMERLFTSVKDGDVTTAEQLLQRRCGKEDYNVLDSHGCSLLDYAADIGQTQLISMLSKAGCSVNMTDFYGQRPLQHAVDEGQLEAAAALITLGADVDWMDENGDGLSALHIAALRGYSDQVALLLGAHGNANAKDSNGVSVLHCAVANGHQKVVELLLEAGADVNSRGRSMGRTPLFIAAEVADLAILKLLLTHGARINVKDDFKLTPLCAACIQNHTEVVSLLVPHRARVNLKDGTQSLPLHYTARHGNTALTQLLLESGSETSTLNEHFESPLHLAVRGAHIDVIRLLIIHGCDVNACAFHGQVTALHVAVNSINNLLIFTQILDLLLQGNCWLDCRAFSSLETALYRAIELNKTDMALMLLQHGADPNIDCPFDITVLHKACQRNNETLVDTLLHCPINWKQEVWLDQDIFSSGINPKLLKGYTDRIPMVLLNNVKLFTFIQEVRQCARPLAQLCRFVVREAVGTPLLSRLKLLNLPGKLEDFLMLKIL